MSIDRLQLTAIGVHRMPGVPRGQGFEIHDLGPGVNVVFGPNGSGKTTLARAIQAILWPTTGRGLGRSLTAAISLGGESWQAEVEGPHVVWRRAGAPSPAPDVGGDDVRHRYRLALVELVTQTEDDAIFAAEVTRAMVGGFDLDAVAKTGGFTGRPSGIRRYREAVDKARAALTGAIAHERDLQHRSVVDLPEREGELRAAREAERLRDACDKAISHRRAREQAEALDRERRELPLAALDACQPKDEEILDRLSERISELEVERDARREERDEACTGIGTADIDRAGIPPEVLERCADLADELGTCDAELARRRGERPVLRSERDRCFDRLGDEYSPAQLAALAGGLRIAEAEALARESHRLRAERAVIEVHRARLPAPVVAADGLDADALRDGRQYLADWMRAQRAGGAAAGDRRPGRAVMVLAAMAAILVASLAVWNHPWWLVAFAPLGAAVWLAFRGDPRLREDGAAQRVIFRRAYERRGLPAPAAWTIDAVAERMRDLEAGLEAARHRKEHEELDGRERGLAQEELAHEEQRAALGRTLGVTLPPGDAWLPVFASSLCRWQDRNDALAAAEAAIAEGERRRASLIDEAADLLRPYGQTPPDSPAGVRRSIQNLKDLDQAFLDRERAERALAERIEPALAAAEDDRSAFFTVRGLADGNRGGLRELLGQLDRLRDVERRWHTASGAVQQAAAAIADHDELLELPVEDLEALRDRHEHTAARRGELEEEIFAIRGDVDRARAGHGVAEARHRLVTARDDLLRTRAESEERAVGSVLLARIRAEAHQASEPEVFVRSRALFARITAGRFELRAPTGDERMFRAYDAVAGVEKTLAELSTGERVQLLISVRLGFLEHQERHCLPLLLDETLGTSDDDRAGEIMDALVDIAGAGRQILYLTAQHDEAGKWAARLEGEDVPFTLIDLGAIRTGCRSRMTPLEIRPVEPPRIAAPAGRSHEEYGRALNAPGLDPFEVKVEQVHLWHVIENCDQLHALLDRKITTIGQFRTCERYAGGVPAGIEEGTDNRVRARAEALERLFAAWRQGRPRPIDLDDLRATGAVSESFETDIAALLVHVDHDPDRLLDALDDRQVPRWRSEKTQQMRAAFARQGVLRQGERLTEADLELRVTASMSEDFDAGLLSSAWIRRVVGSLPPDAG